MLAQARSVCDLQDPGRYALLYLGCSLIARHSPGWFEIRHFGLIPGYKTVELVVEQVAWEPGGRDADSERRPGRPPCLVGVRVAYQDRALQQRIRQVGTQAGPLGAAAGRGEAPEAGGPIVAGTGRDRSLTRGLSRESYRHKQRPEGRFIMRSTSS